MKRFLLSVPVVAILASGCPDPEEKPPVENPPKIPAELSIQWQPVEHSATGAFFSSRFTLDNKGPRELGSSGWKLYFTFSRRFLKDGEGTAPMVQDLARQGIKISKGDKAGSGDYWVLEPLPDFKPIAVGEKRTFEMLAENWAILKADAPAAFHITFEGDLFKDDVSFAVPSTARIDASDPKQTTRFEGDKMPVQTPGLRHGENPAFQELDLKGRLLPTPRFVQPGAGQVTLRGTIAIGYPEALKNETAYLKSALEDVLAASIVAQPAGGGDAQIILSIDPTLDVNENGSPDAEGYVLQVKGGKVTIQGSDAAGVFYGIQTLRQLVPPEAYVAAVNASGRPSEITLPEVHIRDVPGFVHRGMSLDVGRHFQTKETVKKLLDVLAHFKINKFHFHLTDDEGWRLEIPGIPELTSYGSRRGFDPAEAEMLHVGFGSANDLGADDHISLKPGSPAQANAGVTPSYQGFETSTLNFVGKGSGYYTVKDFEEILAYATERHIDVIPEVDMPGHARAAVMSMEYRYRKYKDSDPAKASEYRLVDPADTSKHTSVQLYTDNFVNPCLDTTYAFLDKVVKEIKARYDAVPGARLTAIHGGGDELPSVASNVWWQGSPLCKQNPTTKDMGDIQLANYFFTRWNQIITSTGVAMTGWDDIIHNGLDLPGFIPMPWSNVWNWGREDDAYKFANQGYKVILAHSTNLYMDLAYNKDPDEPGYYWANFVDEKKTFEYRPFDVYVNGNEDRMGNPIAPSTWDGKVRLTEEGKKNIIGMHGLLWSENLKTPEVLEYLAFPKMLGVAERAWNPELPPQGEMPALWARFTNSLGQYVLPRLGAYRAVDVRNELPDDVGVNYRIPLPGAKISEGKLQANVRFPGFAIEYSTDGGNTWSTYSAPVDVSGKVLLRTRAKDGRSSRVAELN